MPFVSRLTRLPVLFLLLTLCLTVPFAAPAVGQEDDDQSQSLIKVPKLGTRPLAIITLSSLQQAREKFEVLCDIAGHPETAEDIISRIDKATDTLAGIDKSRPGGVAIYLDSIFPPAFEFVAFVPTLDTEAFLRTLELGPVISTPVTGEEGRFELLGPTQTSQVRVQNGYAFIQLPFMDPDEEFDRKLFDPVASLASQTQQFDLAVTLDVESVPKATRNLVLSFLTSTMSTQMQQRDEEPEGLYEMRRAWMQADIDSFKMLLDECQRVTIGISVESEQRLANIDFLMDVREGSELLNEITASVTKPSYFAPILNDDSAVSVSMSQVIADRDRQRYIGVLQGLHQELARQITLKNLGPELDETSPVTGALTALQETLNEGHLDLFGQCYADSEGHLVVVGALRVLEGETIAAGLNDMLQRLQDQDGLETLQIGHADHAGIQFHRIEFDDPDPGRDAVLGPHAGFVFGSGPRSMWFGLGGDETMDTVAAVMDQLQTAYENPTQVTRSTNMRIVVNIDQLIQLGETAEAGTAAASAESRDSEPAEDSAPADEKNALPSSRRRERRLASAAARQASWKETFAEGGDRVRLDFQPTKQGGRLRIELGEAFLKGFGRAIAIRREMRNQ